MAHVLYSGDGTWFCSRVSFWDAEVERSPLSRRGCVTDLVGMWGIGELRTVLQCDAVVEGNTTSTMEVGAAIDRNEP